MVTLQLISHFVREKEFLLAIQLLERLLARYPENIALLSATGRLFLQIGVISKAEDFFERVDGLLKNQIEGNACKRLSLMNRYEYVDHDRIFNF